MTRRSNGWAHQALSKAALLVALLGGLAGVAPAKSAETGPVIQAVIANSTFVPREITVAPGTRIVWTNRDEMPHTVTSVDKAFASRGLDTGDKFEFTFSREGDFDYRCTVHPYMTGVVHVRK